MSKSGPESEIIYIDDFYFINIDGVNWLVIKNRMGKYMYYNVDKIDIEKTENYIAHSYKDEDEESNLSTLLKESIFLSKSILKPIEIKHKNQEFFNQKGLGCGRHALNNFFGYKVFKKGKLNDVIKDITPPISLLGICSIISELMATDEQDKCKDNENFNRADLIIALKLTGYKCDDYTDPNKLTSFIKTIDKNVLGFIINLGNNHWVSVKLNNNTYYYYDSKSTLKKGTPFTDDFLQTLEITNILVIQVDGKSSGESILKDLKGYLLE